MTAEKLVKIFLTLAGFTTFLPAIFVKTYTVHYLTLGDRTYSTPRFELFFIPLFFIVLTVLTALWREEIDNYFEN